MKLIFKCKKFKVKLYRNVGNRERGKKYILGKY